MQEFLEGKYYCSALYAMLRATTQYGVVWPMVDHWLTVDTVHKLKIPISSQPAV